MKLAKGLVESLHLLRMRRGVVALLSILFLCFLYVSTSFLIPKLGRLILKSSSSHRRYQLTLGISSLHDRHGLGQDDGKVDEARQEHGGDGQQSSVAVRLLEEAGDAAGLLAEEAAAAWVGEGHEGGECRLDSEVDGEQGVLGGCKGRSLENTEHCDAIHKRLNFSSG